MYPNKSSMSGYPFCPDYKRLIFFSKWLSQKSKDYRKSKRVTQCYFYRHFLMFYRLKFRQSTKYCRIKKRRKWDTDLSPSHQQTKIERKAIVAFVSKFIQVKSLGTIIQSHNLFQKMNNSTSIMANTLITHFTPDTHFTPVHPSTCNSKRK